ncbi:class F sortase [Bogoriella caseilytica]|nr:class F sortase [Bogoriella caseilytica]
MSQHTPSRRFAARRGCAALATTMVLALVAGCASGTAEDSAELADAVPTPAETSVAEGTAAAEATEEAGSPGESAEQDDAGQDDAADAAPETSEESSGEASEEFADDETPVQAAALGDGAIPARVEIPEIGVAEDLIDLGLQDDGTMEVPADWDRAGWFTGGSRPGGPGATVIAGHVDSPTGPAVFFRLTELDVGDRVEIRDVDGALHHYEVYRIEDLPKDDYPTHIVFGATPDDELRLVTCTGEFDGTAQRHLDNRVVFARTIAP